MPPRGLNAEKLKELARAGAGSHTETFARRDHRDRADIPRTPAAAAAAGHALSGQGHSRSDPNDVRSGAEGRLSTDEAILG